ncbi:glycoside hydrolase family 19 protein [Cupriavidus plantarum]|uniref:glycoside hydrolase family 19 protein n=1 Tax=Cupriavidus plantarum TaxID=942865 RepID=UPI0015CBFA9A|nr:putative chitinase [Cupriavidus plantarum]
MDVQTFQASAGLSSALAARWWPHVNPVLSERGILLPARVAAWIAQVGHESLGVTCTREIWGPTASQMRYEGRADLGNVQPGDGKRFLGRGLIQLTGRANYRACGLALGMDLEGAPAILETDALAARSAAWFWDSRNLNALADSGDFVALTRRINGGLNGLEDRRERWDRARRVLGLQDGAETQAQIDIIARLSEQVGKANARADLAEQRADTAYKECNDAYREIGELKGTIAALTAEV